MRSWYLFFIIPCLLVILTFNGCLAAGSSNSLPNSAPFSFSAIVDEVMPSVVFLIMNREGEYISKSGSGIILSSDGYILTNRHVVENARRVEVTLQDRSVYEASGLWLDDILDLAVIKIEAENLSALQFGDPDDIKVGDWAIAIGHPMGLSPNDGGASVTVGIVSNMGWSFAVGDVPYYDTIQTDVAINPGNSGGPLVNLDGELIGINSAAGQAQNINFAISVSTARPVFEDIVKYGRVIRPYLGATPIDATSPVAGKLGLEQKRGALLTHVETDGPAELIGLQENDFIIRFGEVEITTAGQLIKELQEHELGESVKIVFWRGDQEMETTITLAEKPLQDKAQASEP